MTKKKENIGNGNGDAKGKKQEEMIPAVAEEWHSSNYFQWKWNEKNGGYYVEWLPADKIRMSLVEEPARIIMTSDDSG